MKIVRIPNRYRKQLMRLSDKERLWVFDSIFSLSVGINIQQKDDFAGDFLEQIWRDATQMEAKNGKESLKHCGRLICESPATDTASNPHTEVKGKEGKGSEKKGNISAREIKNFTVPKPDEIKKYFQEKSSNEIEAEKFFYFYESKDWKVGKNKMKNWKAAASGWISRNKTNTTPTSLTNFKPYG